jgi:hypothetical protein
VLHTRQRVPWWPATVVVAAAAALSSGCSVTDGLMTSVALPAEPSGSSAAPGDASSAAAMPGQQGQPAELVVSGRQRLYLDALQAGGVQRSSDLLALRIGSYICQARAAGQNAQAVWDYVYPLVNNDVRQVHIDAVEPTAKDVDMATRNYIQIAVERLC